MLDALPVLVAGGAPALVTLRTAVSQLAAALGCTPTYDATPAVVRADALRIAAATPTLVAALHRVSLGLAPVAPDPELGVAADYLRMISGVTPDVRLARALEQYLVLTIDHGFNASTFTARVIASTGADVGAAVVGALGALSGPLHGGAPSRALDTLDAIGDPARAEAWVRAALGRGERIMGFGHAVYRTDDPRSVMLRDVARDLGGERVDAAIAVEDIVLRVLAEAAPRPAAAHERGVLRGRGDGALRRAPLALHAHVRGEPHRRLVRARAGTGAGPGDHPPQRPLRGDRAAGAGAGRLIDADADRELRPGRPRARSARGRRGRSTRSARRAPR